LRLFLLLGVFDVLNAFCWPPPNPFVVDLELDPKPLFEGEDEEEEEEEEEEEKEEEEEEEEENLDGGARVADSLDNRRVLPSEGKVQEEEEEKENLRGALEKVLQ